MRKKKVIKGIAFIVVACALTWYFVVSPTITFHNNEKKMESAARRYFELYSNELPTGERVKTLTLSTMYSKALLDGDFYKPNSNKVCSQTNSWVKVRKNSNGEYEYIVYLDCGRLKSKVDHEGPEIKINGKSTITVGVGDKYKDAGVSSVKDNTDGKINVKDVITKNYVDTSKIGTYEVEYIAYDSLKNKTSVIRTVKVVKKLRSVVKKDLGDAKNYSGLPENNYVRLSNMLFEIYGLDSNNNVILVAAEDVANVNFTKLDEWLNGYYYKHLNKKTKKWIVKSKYCNMQITDTTTDTTECTSYTDDINVYIPSVVEVNRAETNDGNFMKTATISWVANSGKNNKGYVTRNVFYEDEYGKSFLAYDDTYNFGVRPMFTIKNIDIVGGSGTVDDPYTFSDYKKVKGGSSITESTTGEYVSLSNTLYRIIDSYDNYVKVISDDSILKNDYPVTTTANFKSKKVTYNPNDKTSVAYFINNRASEYIDTSYFSSHKVNVPIYKNKIIYGEETSTKKYNLKMFAPNMYELFSAQTNVYGYSSRSYWMLNTSNGERVAAAITDVGVPLEYSVDYYDAYGIRICGFINSDKAIVSGNGTHESPYIIG